MTHISVSKVPECDSLAESAEFCTIILAGGKGTRMYSRERNKVCFLVGGIPAVNRAIEMYNSQGSALNIVIVGDSAQDVIETVGKQFDNASFVFQRRQLGTGNAARCGADLLKKFNYRGPILIVAGDKVIQPEVITDLKHKFRTEKLDCLLTVGPHADFPTSGRVITDELGAACSIIEVRDIRAKEILALLRAKATEEKSVDAQWARQQILSRISSPKKAAVALGDVWNLVESGGRIDSRTILDLIPRERTEFKLVGHASKSAITPDEAEQAQHCNLSVYMFTAEALYYALDRLSSNNAQQEEYLTDAIEILVHGKKDDGLRFKLSVLPVSDRFQVMAYNNPEELLDIQNYLRQKSVETVAAKPAGLMPVADWLALFRKLIETIDESKTSSLYTKLAERYTTNKDVIVERLSAIIHLLVKFNELYGPETDVIVVRAPGRVNIMGKHIDLIGGASNQMAISREVIMAVHPRQDDQVNLFNEDEDEYGRRSFSLSEMIAGLDWDDWLMNVKNEHIQEILNRKENDWANYIQAAVLRPTAIPRHKNKGHGHPYEGKHPRRRWA